MPTGIRTFWKPHILYPHSCERCLKPLGRGVSKQCDFGVRIHWFREDRRPFRVKKKNNNIRIFVDWALDKQNNNFERAVNFLIHFFVVTARPRPYAAFCGGHTHTTKNFSFSFLTGVGSPIINSLKIHLHLTYLAR